MSTFIEQFIRPGLYNGLCYGIAAVGISLPLRFLRTADFTAVGGIMVSGVVAIAVTNATKIWLIGLTCGALVAGCLGLVTAFLALNRRLHVDLLLAGIICFTASQSLGLLLTKGASIDLGGDIAFLRAIFSWEDTTIVAAIAISACLLLSLVARSQWGCLAFAMCGSPQLVAFRHRYSRAATCWLLFVANMVVGVAGGLLVLKTRTAYAAVNTDFLSLTLGAIFTGFAVVRLLGRLLAHQTQEVIEPGKSQLEADTEALSGWDALRFSLSEARRDDSERMWAYFFSYLLASIALNNVAVAVRATFLPSAEHAVLAAIITLGFYLSNLRPARAGKRS